MRIAFAIVGLTAVALGLVACRHEEIAAQHQIHRLQSRLLSQRSTLWDLDVRLGDLTAIDAVAARAQDFDLRMLRPDLQPVGPAEEVLADRSVPIATGATAMDLRR